MSEKVNTKGLNDRERLAIEELSRDLWANKFVNGQMQFTDITNRDYFLKAYGDSIRYCITWNKFLVWNGTNWDVDTRGRVAERCVKFIHQMYRGLRVIDDRQLQAAFEKHLIKSESFRRIQALEGLFKISEEIKVEDFELDTNNYFFNVDKYTLNLKTMRVIDPNQKHLITKKSNFIFEKVLTVRPGNCFCCRFLIRI